MSEQKDSDRQVSDAYRDLGRPGVPAELDAQVLKTAHDAIRPTGRGWQGWMLPTAWVATLGLAVALVLQQVELPGIQDATDTQPSEAESAFSQRAGDVREMAEEMADMADADNRETDISSLDSTQPETEPPTAANGARREQASVAADSQTRPLSTAAEAAPAAQAPGALQRQSREDSSPSSGQSAARSLEKRSLNSAMLLAACPEAERETAENWYRCIVELRERGMDATAERELQELRTEFPDVDVRTLSAEDD